MRDSPKGTGGRIRVRLRGRGVAKSQQKARIAFAQNFLRYRFDRYQDQLQMPR
jgi:hypothetical protein